jgi:hypothetical protein
MISEDGNWLIWMKVCNLNSEINPEKAIEPALNPKRMAGSKNSDR